MLSLFLVLLLENGVIAGRVLAADTGTPLSKARVTISQMQGNGNGQFALTGPDGAFRFTLEPGVYKIHAARNGYTRSKSARAVSLFGCYYVIHEFTYFRLYKPNRVSAASIFDLVMDS